MGLKIINTGSFLPDQEVDNFYFENYLDTDNEWIVKRTGIEKRRISTNCDVREMSIESVRKMNLTENEIKKIKLIIVTTLSADYIMPSVSSSVAGYLSKQDVLAFDLNMACTGFAGASLIAEKYIEDGDYALIVSTEVLSKFVDFNNRNSAILFGDGSGAVLYEKTSEKFFSDNGTVFSEDLLLVGKSLNRESTFIEMDGKNVYRFTMEYIPKSILKTIEKSDLNEDDIDFFILHQANIRIIEGISKRIGKREKYYTNLNRLGNTSSATIPICLDEMKRKNLLNNKKILLSGFGGGLNYATCIVETGGERK